MVKARTYLVHQLVCSADQLQVVGRNEIVSHLHSLELKWDGEGGNRIKMGWGGGSFEEPWVRTAIQRHVAKQPSCQPDQMSFKFAGMGENITFERKLMMRVNVIVGCYCPPPLDQTRPGRRKLPCAEFPGSSQLTESVSGYFRCLDMWTYILGYLNMRADI